MLSKHNLTAKIIIIKNLKIQMLAGNSLKMCVGAGFEISSTLVSTLLLHTILPTLEMLLKTGFKAGIALRRDVFRLILCSRCRKIEF